MTDAALSPGAATAERARWEEDILREVEPVTDTIIRELADAAHGSIGPNGRVLLASSSRPVSLTAASAFTLGTAVRAWQRVAEKAFDTVAARLAGEGPMSERYLTTLRVRLDDDAHPRELFERFREALTEHAEPGAAVDDLAAELTRSDSVARVVSREFATAAYGFAQLDRFAAMGKTHKRWVAHHDFRTRPSHLRASGQSVPLESSFMVGGFALMVPGDPAGPATETHGCRCVLASVR